MLIIVYSYLEGNQPIKIDTLCLSYYDFIIGLILIHKCLLT